MYTYGGVHKWRYPKMAGLQWKIPVITGGTPIYGNPDIKDTRGHAAFSPRVPASPRPKTESGAVFATGLHV